MKQKYTIIGSKPDKKWDKVFQTVPKSDTRPCKKCGNYARRNGSAFCGRC